MNRQFFKEFILAHLPLKAVCLAMKDTNFLIRLAYIMRRTAIFLSVILPLTMQAQFAFVTNNGAITIIGYTGSGEVVTIPGTTNGLSVRSISNSVFASSNIKSVTIPDSVTNIGRYAFANCLDLTNVVLGKGIKRLYFQTFRGCTNLTSLTIPTSVTYIEQEVFEKMGLTRISIPDTVTNIEGYAFDENESLTNITIGSGVMAIGTKAFNSYLITNYNLSIYFKGNAPSVGDAMANYATIYYLPGTTGWTTNFGGFTAMLWNPHAQTGDGFFGVRTNRFGFNISGTTNIPVAVEVSTNLSSGTWIPLQSLNLTNGSYYFSDAQWTTNSRRFYRFRAP